MSNLGPYIPLVEAAKAAGGPEAFLAHVKAVGAAEAVRKQLGTGAAYGAGIALSFAVVAAMSYAEVRDFFAKREAAIARGDAEASDLHLRDTAGALDDEEAGPATS